AAAAPVNASEVRPATAVQAAAEVDQAWRLVDEGGEQVGGDDVDRHDAVSGVDPGVVDHGVHPAQAIDLTGQAAHLFLVCQIPYDARGAHVEEVAQDRQALGSARVDDNLVAGVQ